MDGAVTAAGVFVFGRFRLDPVRRRLLHDAMPVSLPPRLFDTLHYLLAHADRVVAREELLRVVWAGRVVEDANIKQTIFSLRRVLKDHGGDEECILTIPQSGYRIAVKVSYETLAACPIPASLPARDAVAGTRPDRMRWLGPRLASLASLASLTSLAALTALGAFAVWATLPPPPPPNSLAVLAFGNLTGDARQEYLSDGISAELISALSRVGGIRVVSSRSSFAFKGSAAGIGDIARRLNVGAVLEGNVRRSGTHVRITVDLVNAGTGYTMWSQEYDRDESDMLAVQQDIAASTARALRVTLLGEDTARLIVGGTHDQRAFDAYLRGMAALNRPGDLEAAAKMALAGFDSAISLDPDFALAYAHRSHALTIIATSGDITDAARIQGMMMQARAAADRAIAIAPGLAGGHLARGNLLLDNLDFAGGESEIALAHELAPGDSTVLMDYASMQIAFGRTESGIAAAGQAALLDPLTAVTYIQLAADLIAAGADDAAETALHRANILGGGPATAELEANLALARGEFVLAARECSAGNSVNELMCLAIADHALGQFQVAAAFLDRLHGKLGDGGAYQYAEILAQFGRLPEAFSWLSRAVALHDPGLIQLKSDELLKPLRSHAQYRQIVEGLHFPI